MSIIGLREMMLLNNKLKSSVHYGWLLALVATLLYSLKPVLVKLIYVYDVSSVDILAWRVIISLPIYSAAGIWVWHRYPGLAKGKSPQAEPGRVSWLIKAVLLGFIGYYLAALFDLIGLQTISSQLARLILFTYPTLVAVLGWLLLKQKINRNVVLTLLFSYIGVSLIFAHDMEVLGDQVIYGASMMFLSALCFSIYVLFSKSVIDEVGSMPFTVVAMLASGVCLLPHFWVGGATLEGLIVPLPAFVLVFLMTVLTTVIPSFMLAEAILRVGSQRTAIAGTIGPAATSVFAVLILGEAFGPAQLAGIVLVVIAIVNLQLQDRSATETPENGEITSNTGSTGT